MKALVLVGGLGTRLRPVTYSVPKQLIPVAGQPMLYHVLDLLPPSVDEVVLAAGYKAELVERYVRDHPPRVRVRTVREPEPLGTGGGMKNAGGAMSDPFFLLNSDVVAAADLAAMEHRQERSGGIGTMALTEVDDTRPFGVAALAPDDRITAFVEKPEPKDAPSHWINAGLAVWRREVLDRIPEGRPVSFEREIVPGLLARNIYGHRLTGYWDDAGTPERLLHAQRLLFDDGRGAGGQLPSGSSGQGPVAAMEGASASGATFGGYVTLGPRARVEPGARLENAVLMDDVVVGAGAIVEGSLLGPRVRVPAGATVRNAVLAAEGEARAP
jgi:mannose-1-phosphate guanylyltransferase